MFITGYQQAILQSLLMCSLRRFSRISQDIEAALHQESVYNQRLALSAVEDRIDGLLQELQSKHPAS